MPWTAQNVMSLKHEFVLLVNQGGVPASGSCAGALRSARTGYKWLPRFDLEGTAGLRERSRRPASSPTISAAELDVLCPSQPPDD